MPVRAVGINHIGLEVPDLDEALARYGRFLEFELRGELVAAGIDVEAAGSLRVHDPGGNQLEIVDYRDIQFSKTDAVLAGMGLAGLVKHPGALAELREKGLL